MKNKSFRGSIGAPIIFTEVGFGNSSLVSSEIEWPDGHERRVVGRVRGWKLRSVYVRLWVWKLMLILDLRQGVVFKRKGHPGFKFVFGGWGNSVLQQKR